MAISKVILDGDTIMDVTDSTTEANKMLNGIVGYKADGTKATGSIASRGYDDVIVNGRTVTTPAGYYSSAVNKQVATGSATPAASIGATGATVTTGTNTLTLSKSVSNTPQVSAGYVSSGTAGNSSVSLTATVNTRSSSDLTVNGNTVTAPAGYYASSAEKVVATGTAGTPTATKGTVSNHAVSVTPSVTNTTGYITGGTKTGTAVSVSASELVSGTKSITENGTNIDVANYSAVDVSIASGGVYTVTIDGNGDSSYCWVKVNNSGTAYYTDGDTFTYEDGDYLYLRYRGNTSSSGTTSTLTVNGELLDSTPSTTSKYYTITNPRCDMTIEFSFGSPTNVNITDVNVTSISENGIKQMEGNPFVNVNISGMDESQLKAFIQRNSTFTDITWPSGMTEIGPYAFASCSYFAPSSLPSGITSIGTYAFSNCSVFSVSSLPSGVSTIGSGAFNNCYLLNLTSLPSGITYIRENTFYNCRSLTLSSLPSGVTSIGNYAFFGCETLAISSLPSGVSTIGNSAFYNCHDLAISSLPNSVTSIGSSAFYGCESIPSISCSGAIVSLGSGAFNGSVTHPMQITSASFPNLAITSNLGTVFGSGTAGNASQLLEFCDIGSATGIGATSFANCYALETLVIRKSTVAALANVSAFTNTPMRGYNSKTGTVYVPSSLISSYQTATNWKTLYDGGTLTFSAIEGSDYEL